MLVFYKYIHFPVFFQIHIINFWWFFLFMFFMLLLFNFYHENSEFIFRFILPLLSFNFATNLLIHYKPSARPIKNLEYCSGILELENHLPLDFSWLVLQVGGYALDQQLNHIKRHHATKPKHMPRNRQIPWQRTNLKRAMNLKKLNSTRLHGMFKVYCKKKPLK